MRSLITHDGVFHCDEVTAIAVLHELYPEAELTRTRDPEILKAGLADPEAILVDVGDVYDEDLFNYDHHQRENKPDPRTNGVPYSSAGLVWRRFGRDFVSLLLGDESGELPPNILMFIVDYVDETLIQYIDATDNGALQGARVLRDNPDVRVRTPSISYIVSGFNPSSFFLEEVAPLSFEEHGIEPLSNEQLFMGQFSQAAEFVSHLLVRTVYQAVSVFVAKKAVQEGYRAEQRVVVLGKFVPWEEHVHEVAPEALYVIFPNATGDTVMVQQVAVRPGSFEGKKPLPESWAGLRDEDFSKETGIADGVFCHAGRFICGARTMTSALVLAEKAVNA